MSEAIVIFPLAGSASRLARVSVNDLGGTEERKRYTSGGPSVFTLGKDDEVERIVKAARHCETEPARRGRYVSVELLDVGDVKIVGESYGLALAIADFLARHREQAIETAALATADGPRIVATGDVPDASGRVGAVGAIAEKVACIAEALDRGELAPGDIFFYPKVNERDLNKADGRALTRVTSALRRIPLEAIHHAKPYLTRPSAEAPAANQSPSARVPQTSRRWRLGSRLLWAGPGLVMLGAILLGPWWMSGEHSRATFDSGAPAAPNPIARASTLPIPEGAKIRFKERLRRGATLVAYNHQKRGRTAVFNDAGELLWSDSVRPKECIYNEPDRIFEQFPVHTAAITPKGTAIVSYVNSPWFPSVAIEYAADGTRLGRWWSPGPIVSVASFDYQDRSLVVLAGINNNMRHLLGGDAGPAFVALFDITRTSLAGQAPPVFGFLKQHERGNHEWIRFMPVIPEQDGAVISDILPQRLNPRKLIAVFLKDGRVYYFDRDGHPTGTGVGDNYRREYGGRPVDPVVEL